jgi:predicted neutral ceramidase superfamily lipid hydrolase
MALNSHNFKNILKYFTLFLNTMQQLSALLIFYRPYTLWSFGINMLLSILGYNLFLIFFVKLILVAFLWYLMNETHAKRKLIFYKNLGISTFKLFSYVFVIDFILSLPFLIILKEFI